MCLPGRFFGLLRGAVTNPNLAFFAIIRTTLLQRYHGQWVCLYVVGILSYHLHTAPDLCRMSDICISVLLIQPTS